jgi:hypothetical protein
LGKASVLGSIRQQDHPETDQIFPAAQTQLPKKQSSIEVQGFLEVPFSCQGEARRPNMPSQDLSALVLPFHTTWIEAVLLLSEQMAHTAEGFAKLGHGTPGLVAPSKNGRAHNLHETFRASEPQPQIGILSVHISSGESTGGL